MKIVHSLWSKPALLEKGIQGIRGSFPTPTHYWASWAYSALTAHKHFGEVELIADTKAAKVLADYLKLPYTSVRIELDGLDDVNPKFWAFGKIVAYSLQEQPFYHIDSDAYIMKPFPDDLLTAPLVVQNYESTGNREKKYSMGPYISAGPINDLLPYKPDGWGERFNDYRSYNMGIFGGTDVAEIQSYAAQVIRMVRGDENRAAWGNLTASVDGHWANVIFEQQAAYCYFQSKGKEPRPVWVEGTNPMKVDMGFVHLMARRSKADVAQRLLDRLQSQFPEYYDRVLDLVPRTHSAAENKLPPNAVIQVRGTAERGATANRDSAQRSGGCGCGRMRG